MEKSNCCNEEMENDICLKCLEHAEKIEQETEEQDLGNKLEHAL